MFRGAESPPEDPEQAAIASPASRKAVGAPASRTRCDLLPAFVQRLLDFRLQVLVVAHWAYHLPVEEEGGRIFDAGLGSVPLVGQGGRFVAPGVQASGERLRVQRQLGGVGLELVRQEGADAFTLPAGEQQVMVLPELPLVAGALRRLGCIVRLIPKEGEILEDVPYLARVHVLLDQLRAPATPEKHPKKALESRRP